MTARLLRIVVCSATTCMAVVASAKPLFPKAEITPDQIRAAIRFEWQLRDHYDAPPPLGESWFKIIPGKSLVIVSAPHATAQTREGEQKPADAGTGALAFMLHELTDATTIYTMWRSPSDPNFYDDNAYKHELRRVVETTHPKLVIDLHVSHWYRPYDVDFGTLNGQSLLNHESWLVHIADFMRASGLRNFSQDYFSAADHQTVTKFVHNLGTPCVQMEINETWLQLFDDAGLRLAEVSDKCCGGNGSHAGDIADDLLRVDEVGAHRFAELLEALVRFIRSIDTQH